MEEEQGKKRISLWEEMIKNDSLNNSLKLMFCYSTKDQRTYHLSWCTKKTKGFFGLFNRNDALLFLQKKQATVKVGLVQQQHVNPKWNHNLGLLFNFHQFIDNQIASKGQILVTNSQKYTHIQLCGQWEGLEIANNSDNIAIHFESEQTYLLWKRLITQQLPGLFQVANLSKLEKQNLSSFMNDAKHILQEIVEAQKLKIIQSLTKKGQLLLNLEASIRSALNSIGETKISQIEKNKIIQDAQIRVQQIQLLHNQLQRISAQLTEQQKKMIQQQAQLSALGHQNVTMKSVQAELLQANKQLQIRAQTWEELRNQAISSNKQLQLSFQAQLSLSNQLKDRLAQVSQQIVCLKQQAQKEQSEKNQLITQLDAEIIKAERGAESEKQKDNHIQELLLQLQEQKAKLHQIEKQHRDKLNEIEEANNKQLRAILDQQRQKTENAIQQAREAQMQANFYKNQRFLHIFEGRVLHSSLPEKEFLTAQIQRYSNKTIKITNLLYRYDHLNTVNFHSYIDNHPHFCVVIKLTNGRLIAGYSVGPLYEGMTSTEGGLIVSLSEKKCFQLTEGRRAIVFDKFFLIFGNSQLRLRQGQKTFFTNFGINNSFYDSRGQKYCVLSGEESARESSLEDYQIFQVIFD